MTKFAVPVASPFANPTQLPFRGVGTIAHSSMLSPVLVVAPHPDDETLGCGGAIALLRAIGCEVRVLVMSDGTLSHPNSRRYPATALQTLREQETRRGVSILGVNAAAVTFLRFKDGEVPTTDSSGIRGAIALCCSYLADVAPQTILLPWRHDPHPDHRATWKLIHTALLHLPLSPKLIEYPIWDWDPEQRSDRLAQAVAGWRLNIAAVVETKQRAIAQYRSQITNLIDDDPEGFCLTSDMLANFTRPWEVYFEELA